MANREFRLDYEYPYDRSSPARWVWSHLMRYPLLPLGLFLTATANNTFFSYVQVLIGQGFTLITTPGWETLALASIAVWIFGTSMGQGLTGLARNYFTEYIAQRIERDARQELYASLLGKSQTFHGRQRVGDIMARATNDVRQLNAMFSPGIMLITDSALNTALPIIWIGITHPYLLLVPLVFLVLLALTLWDYTRQIRPVSGALRAQFGQLNAGLAETVAGITVVKANAQEPFERARFVASASRYRDLFVRQGDIQARYLPVLVLSITFAVAFLHGVTLWRAGIITPGQLVTFMGLMGGLRFPTFISLFSFDLVQLGLASAERILELINTETELDENTAGVAHPMRGAVRFENVSFQYHGTPVLQNLSFSAQPGETIAIVGQTGSGKTALTRLINRIFDTSSGRVLIDDVDVRDWQIASLRGQISTIEQDIFLFSRTIAENIAFGLRDATPAAIEEAARAAQAHDFIMSFEHGYQTVVGERGVMLSGGQRQRLAIARAFLTNPPILILDDSTSAIDSATEDQIQRAMRQISRERTTFLITHRLSQIRWADRILVLQKGKLVDQGTHDDLLARSHAYQKIFARYT